MDKTMKKIIDWTICSETNPSRLDGRISDLIQLGWQPYGELKVNYDDCSLVYTQVLVKYEDDDIIEG